ncbi:MAG: hypothetical protein PHR16_06615 [Methylovulum sp.]|nr:hypothetical protein [Methylovulum sp.]
MHSLLFLLVVSGILYALHVIVRQTSQLGYIQRYRFHPAIRQKFKKKHPTLTESQVDSVFLALRDYFYCCNRAKRRMVSMPSQVVDDAWHEFILFTRSYGQFCQKAFGRYLHHTPAEAMTRPTLAQDGIKRAWRLACVKEKLNPLTPARLPLLFSIDTQLAIANGFVYNLHCMPGDNSYCASHIGCGGDRNDDIDFDVGADGGCSSDGGCSGGCGGGD